MKKICLYTQALVTALLCLFATSCDKDLPFPIDEVTRGVVIDIVRVAGTDGVLSDGVISGNYKVQLTIPTYQGDYSMMSHAQLLAVLSDGTTTTSKVAVDNITTFPSTIDINVGDVYSKFGKTSPSLGETLTFTVSIVLKSGEVIPGWNEYTGRYNNTAFTGWLVDGRNYSYRVQYSVVCPFDPNSTFIGTFKCSESSSYGTDTYDVTLSEYAGAPTTIPAGVDASKLYGLQIDPISPNIWQPVITSTIIWINTEDFSVVTENQPTGENYSTGAPIVWAFKDASVSTCTRQIKFTATPTIVGVGSYAAITFTITPN